MDIADVMLIVALSVIIGSAFIVGKSIRATLRADRQELRRIGEDRGQRLDLYLGLVWSGMLLVQASSVLRHMGPGGSYDLSSLAAAATAGNIFVCGVFAGRLLLRREMRLAKERREVQSRAPN
ncbi:MAG TPA: hypothetical protein VGF92_18515 [Stellaceae bacterium]